MKGKAGENLVLFRNYEASSGKIVRANRSEITCLTSFFEGIHSTKDIPDLVESIKQSHPSVEFVLTNTLGEDDLLVDLVIKRVVEASPELSLPQVDREHEAAWLQGGRRLIPGSGYSIRLGCHRRGSGRLDVRGASKEICPG